MGLMSGAMTVRRFRVAGTPGDGWRERFRERLNAMAFRESPTSTGKEEHEGWVQVHNLLFTSFDDFNVWLYGNFAVFALRVDKKTVPAKLLKATVELELKKWCEENGLERAPSSKKKQLKEALEEEWLKRALPRVGLTELVWNLEEGYVVIDSLSDGIADRVRKRFHRTFGYELLPWSPLDYTNDSSLNEALLATVPTAPGGEA